MPTADEIESNIRDNILSNASPSNMVDDDRIDADAQSALLRMFDGDQGERLRAVLLLAWVNAGALNAIRKSTSPVNSFSFDGDGGAAPALVYGDQLPDSPDEFDRQLVGAANDGRNRFGSPAASQLAAGPETPWLCAWVCALCVLALLDGVPFDEIPVCAVCVSSCAGSA
jgi:hypothetical protein